MANIKKIDGKTGISYKITVTKGRDLHGKQIRHYLTWIPEAKMTERQIKKAVERVAFEFEQSIDLGYQIDNRKTFADYAEYVLSLKEREGVKYRTIERYRELLVRINPAIGHLKLTEIRPQHLNDFYKNLGEYGISDRGAKATVKTGLSAILKESRISKAQLARLSGCSLTTLRDAIGGKKITLSIADSISKALSRNTNELFSVESGAAKLADKTILEHHRLIRTILGTAEKEMIVPYNAASKASPPKISRKQEVNYFQPEEITAILEALDDEPLKWQVATNLLIVSGCRRGEIMGLKWDHIDFLSNQIRIDTTIQYSPKRGIYESTTKTEGSNRVIKLPVETIELLRDYRSWYLDQSMKAGDRWIYTNFVFVKDDGTPMIPDALTQWLRVFAKRHDLPHINPHAFRHTMASILIKNGTDIVSVSKRLGHARTSTTTDIYSHLIKEADEEASECLADMLLRPKKEKRA